MEHKFNVEIATMYGLEEAILLNNLYFWIEKNEANEKHFYDGYYWTYNSLKAFQKLFPYISKGKLERAIETLKEVKIIITGNYNETAYDRTTWYAITKEGVEIIKNKKTISENQKCIPEIEKSISLNQKYITDIKPYDKPDIQDCIADAGNFSKNEKEVLQNPPTNPTSAKTTQNQTPNNTLSELSLEFFKDFWSMDLLRTPPAGGFEVEFRKFFDYWGRIKSNRKESKYANDWRNYLKEWITHDWNIKPKKEFKNASPQQMVQPALTDNRIPCIEIPITKPDIPLLNERMVDEIMQRGSVHGLNYFQYFKKCFIIDYDFKETEGIIRVDVITNTNKAKDAILSDGKMEILQDSIKRAFGKKNILIEINLQIPHQGECINIKLVEEKI